jgi:DUF4097 and DUF4098 domain-containing protein YvlB
MRRLTVPFLLIFALLLMFQSCHLMKNAYEKVEKTIPVQPKMQLILENRDGNISVEVWNQTSVSMIAEKRTSMGRKELASVSIETSTTEDTLFIKTISAVPNQTVTVDYLLKVPSTIYVSRLQTENGNITLSNTKGDLIVQTTNGSIELDKIDGWVSAVTINGSVKITKATGIKRIQTTNGLIYADIENFPQEGTHVETSNANVELKIIHKGGMYLDLATTNGLLQLKGFGSKDFLLRNMKEEVKILEGGKKLFVRTENGNILINK